VLDGETTKLFPVPTDVPSQEPVIHLNRPEPPVYNVVLLFPPHIVVAVAVTEVGAEDEHTPALSEKKNPPYLAAAEIALDPAPVAPAVDLVKYARPAEGSAVG
jgi:hypothetical protein